MEPSNQHPVTLGSLTQERWNEVFAMTSLPEVGGNLRYGVHSDPAQAKELIQVLTTGSNRGYALLVGETLVGICAYKGEPQKEDGMKECHLTILLHPEHWGRGYSTAAIGELLGLARGEGYSHMTAYVREDNVGSCRMLEKNRFMRVHTFPNDEGDGCPVHIYQMKL